MQYTEQQLRHIDALIAEQFFGWAWATARGTGTCVLMPPLMYQDKTESQVIWKPGKTTRINFITGRYFDSFHFPEFEHYTTDHNACAELRKRLREMGKHESFADRVEMSVCDGLIEYDRNGGADVDMNEMFKLIDSSPLQQCIAALRAVGVDVDDELKRLS